MISIQYSLLSCDSNVMNQKCRIKLTYLQSGKLRSTESSTWPLFIIWTLLCWGFFRSPSSWTWDMDFQIKQQQNKTSNLQSISSKMLEFNAQKWKETKHTPNLYFAFHRHFDTKFHCVCFLWTWTSKFTQFEKYIRNQIRWMYYEKCKRNITLRRKDGSAQIFEEKKIESV